MNVADVQVSVLSKIGGRARNEDACGYWSAERSPFACFVLADGAGGHGGGDVASQVSVQAVLDHYALDPDASPEHVLAMLKRANQSVMARQACEQHLSDMRSTMVVLQIDTQSQSACWGHVGDSRLYCFRGGQLERRTKDHSLLQELLDAGLAHLPAAASDPSRNLLTGSLGGDDCFTPTATDQLYSFDSDCAFLLCSDGFWSELSEDDMRSTLCLADSPQRWISSLEQRFLGRIAPGSDNYSAIALWFKRPPQPVPTHT
jgi:PPM family protein phosphatase